MEPDPYWNPPAYPLPARPSPFSTQSMPRRAPLTREEQSKEITKRLLKLDGAFLISSLSEDFDPFGPSLNSNNILPTKQQLTDSELERKSALTLLNQTCHKTFGRTQGIMSWCYVDNGGQRCKACSLTIRRPDGDIRIYTTLAQFTKNKEAQQGAAQLAVELGAVDFLLSGNDGHRIVEGSEAGSSGTVVQATLGQVYVPPSGGPEGVESQHIGDIELCCQEWRTGKLQPQWLILKANTLPPQFGAMLRIALSFTCCKVWSVDSTFSTPIAAKNAVVEVAVHGGVLDFIKFGNDQKSPNEGEQDAMPPLYAVSHLIDANDGASDDTTDRGFTLKEFAMRLPEPPSPVENVGVLKQNQMNPIAYVNQVLQKAQAAKMVASHTYVSNLSNKYHGCLLRVGVSGDQSGSWFVDARFPSRQDARKAVCLYALSCGEFDSFVRKTVERRTLAVVTELLGPIEAECIARRLPTPEFTLTQSLEKKKDITATVTLRNAEGKIRSHSVNGTYFVHLEAKLAVLQLAMKNNILSFIRTAPRPDLKGVWPNPSNHPPLIRYGAVTLPVHPQLAFENRPSALSYVGTAKARPQASREDDLEDGELMEE